MSKVIISTNRERVDSIIKETAESGIKLGHSAFKECYSVASFTKLNIDNENNYICNDGAIISAGNLI